ncbi:MAG TPA: hypothetical protein VGW34_13255 [Allosphingosinicella sp.]|nr:hypothetical protein [Allosphingosinicella sp.]
MTASHSAPPGHADQPHGYWQHPALLGALILLSALPVLIADVAPLTDLPGHMGRYRVQLDLAHSEALQRFFRFEWALIGNLGIDLLVVPLAKLFGLEPAVKLIVTAIPVLTVWGFLLVAREVHGRIPPTAFFALPFAYGYPFMFGFVNFALSMAFAFLAFGFWLHLARLDRLRLRAALFVPISGLVWITHTFGWGALGVLAFSAELVRQVDQGRKLAGAGLRAALHSLALAPPILLMLFWRSGQVGGQTADWFNWRAKWLWIQWVLRDRWEWFDLGAVVVVAALLVRALRSPRIEFSRNLAASALFLSLVFLLLPRIIFGSAYADMRLVPYLLAVAVLAIRLKGEATLRFANAAAAAALAFAAVRMGGTAASFWLYDRDYDRQLAALDHVPEGARLVSFVGRKCGEDRASSRLEHLPAMATVRRRAFTNDQWTMAGAQLLSVHYPPGEPFVRDPSQVVTALKCRYERWLPIAEALRRLPREAFDYVWLINPPPYGPELVEGLEPVWRSGTSVLYRVVDRGPPGSAAEESE